ncbi:hypothetical protein ANO11243_071110 [Dothideomycetidae sp. 11243]|nr:hypothetical protein ANO11243_071110 [fungal sp. No.11243]
MSAPASGLRAVRGTRIVVRRSPRVGRPNVRCQSTTSSSGAASGASSHLISGLAGGAAALGVAYGLYSYSSAGRLHSSINKTTSEANKYYQTATKKFQESTPDANEAIEYLRKTAYTYAAFIPGGRGYVDTAFKDLDTMREKHSDKIDSILKDTYTELQKASKSGLSMDTVQKVYSALEEMSKRLASEAGDAFSSVIDNHPELKEKLGPKMNQLKQMGDQYGPQAKEQVEQTYKEVQDALKSGFSPDTFNKVRKLVEDKVEKLQQFGEEAWKEGLKQAQPYLDKNPKIKELVENNADALKKGNISELFEKVKSGKLDDLQSYVDQAKDKVKKEGSKLGSKGGMDFNQLLDKIPAAGAILPKLQQLRQAADKHKGEGEQLLKETMEELQKLLEEKAKKAQDLMDKVKKEN